MEMTSKANLVQDKSHKKNGRYNNKKHDHIPKPNSNPTFKKKWNCYVCGKSCHRAPQCMKRMRNDNPSRSNENIFEGDDKIDAVISHVCLIANVKEYVIDSDGQLDSSATKHICTSRDVFTSYIIVGEGEEHVYLSDSRTLNVLGKEKVLLKLTFGKTSTLNDILHMPNIIANLIYVALLGKSGVKVSFEYNRVVMIKNNVFMGKNYCN